RGADVSQPRVEARRLPAGFLQGPLVEGLGGFPLGAAARTRPPRLLTRDPEICSIDICRSRDFGGCFTRIRACVSEFGHCGGGGGGGDTLNAFCPTREFVCGQSAGCTFGPECGQTAGGCQTVGCPTVRPACGPMPPGGTSGGR